jgi:hypothetical protein
MMHVKNGRKTTISVDFFILNSLGFSKSCHYIKKYYFQTVLTSVKSPSESIAMWRSIGILETCSRIPLEVFFMPNRITRKQFNPKKENKITYYLRKQELAERTAF